MYGRLYTDVYNDDPYDDLYNDAVNPQFPQRYVGQVASYADLDGPNDFSLNVFCIPVKVDEGKMWQPKKWLKTSGHYSEIAQICNKDGGGEDCNYVMKVIKLDPSNDIAERKFWNEVELQTEAAEAGLAPKIMDSWVCDQCKGSPDEQKCPYIGVIIMPTLKRTLKDIIKDSTIDLHVKHKYLIEAFTVLEKLNKQFN